MPPPRGTRRGGGRQPFESPPGTLPTAIPGRPKVERVRLALDECGPPLFLLVLDGVSTLAGAPICTQGTAVALSPGQDRRPGHLDAATVAPQAVILWVHGGHLRSWGVRSARSAPFAYTAFRRRKSRPRNITTPPRSGGAGPHLTANKIVRFAEESRTKREALPRSPGPRGSPCSGRPPGTQSPDVRTRMHAGAGRRSDCCGGSCEPGADYSSCGLILYRRILRYRVRRSIPRMVAARI